jgi:hypothetical protein
VKYLLEKVEVLFGLGREISIAAIGRNYGVKKNTIYFSKENKK